VLDRTGEDVGDGFDAAMRVPGEAFELVLGVFVAEVIEEEKRVEVFGFAEAERALEADTCAFEGRFGRQDLSHWSQ
jgi:hypothetical protein